jgi:hypothetical protein
MPKYTLDELEKKIPNEKLQLLLFGITVKEMRQLDPTKKFSTWCDLDDHDFKDW